MESLVALLLAGVFAFGLLVGSFLNVVIYRYNTGLSPIKGRSCCFSCGKTLRWYELLPVISYLWQGRKCRSCKSVLSSQYIAVELVTAFLFTVISLRLGLQEVFFVPAEVLFWWVVASVLIVITVYDLRHTVIPDGLALLMGILGLVSLYARGGGILDLAVGLVTALIFAGIWYFSGGRAMGLGDAKLVLGVGWLLPYERAISAILASFWLGAIIGVALLVLQRKKITMKTEIPFAPFLAAGFFSVFLLDISLIIIY